MKALCRCGCGEWLRVPTPLVAARALLEGLMEAEEGAPLHGEHGSAYEAGYLSGSARGVALQLMGLAPWCAQRFIGQLVGLRRLAGGAA